MMNFQQPILVHKPSQLSVHWAQTIVNQHTAHAQVFAVNLRSVDVGTSTRLRIEVEHDATGVLPNRWFVKTPSLAFKSRLITALPRFLHKEVSFYNEVAADIPLALPKVLAAQSRFGRGSTLVLTDLAEMNYRPGQAADALTLEQASQVIGQLAQLHGRYWHNQYLVQRHQWLSDFSHHMENTMGSLLAVPLMRRGLASANNLVPQRLHAAALYYAAKRRSLKAKLAQHAQTLVHYDCHPGNLFWTDSGPGFLDWQLVRLGDAVGDVAYFLANALQPELRRAHEKQLLNQYLQHLQALGIAELDEHDLWQRYRAHLVYPFEAMLITLAIGGMMDVDSNVALIQRTVAAVDDHDSFTVLKNLV